MEITGQALSMHSDAIYKGNYTHNGMLLKIHENSFTTGYSRLRKADDTAEATVYFGDGVFFDAHQKNNIAYVGAPSFVGAVPVFGGIVVREPDIASGYPALNNQIAPFQRGLIAKQGFIEYKVADYVYGTGLKYEAVQLYDHIYPNFAMFVSKTDGKVYFSPKSTVSYQAGDIYVGRVIGMNPDDKSITVLISPAIYADTADIAAATPSVVAGTATTTTIPLTLSIGIKETLLLYYKVHSDPSYTKVEEEFTPVLNTAKTAYEVTHTLEGLTLNTSYDIQVVAFGVCGMKSATITTSTSAE